MQHNPLSSNVPRKPTTAPLRSSVNSASGGVRHKPGRPHYVSPLPGLNAATPALTTGATTTATSSALVPINAAATTPAAATSSSNAGGGRKKPSLISPTQKANLQATTSTFRSQQGRPTAAGGSTPAFHGDNDQTRNALSTAVLRSGTKKSRRHTKGANDAASSVVAVGPERDSVAFRLCCEALAEGCVQTYMHLFQLAHRDPVCVDPLAHTYFSVPGDRLAWVQQQLSAVEVLRRQSELGQVLSNCEQLADYFEGERDYAEATWCYETALQYMMESLDRTLEQRARHSYAVFEERRGNFEGAAALYEAMYRQALALGDADGVQNASQCLVRVYQALGNALKERDPAAAAAYFSKVRSAAQHGGNAEEECAAYSALGDVSEARGDYPRALAYNRSYRAVAQREELRPQECLATLRVADLEERLGLKLEASATLQEALQLAKELGEPQQLCRATMQLGEAYRAHGQEKEALQCFEESFSAALDTGEQELVDKVRIAIGFARGDHSLAHAYHGEGYLQLVCTDIRAQLAWMSGGTL
jgi:tetratricopeptide (TPR) repeat protein